MTPKKQKPSLENENQENIPPVIKWHDNKTIQSSQAEEISIEYDSWVQSRRAATVALAIGTELKKAVDSETASKPESDEDITLVNVTTPNLDSDCQEKADSEEPLCWGCAKLVVMWDNELKRPVSVAAPPQRTRLSRRLIHIEDLPDHVLLAENV
ncbi:hypothetical protein BT96DRAFT_996250 [Gymnopus androsaceus JB14]|uniref:Uncharacterized protein n=1 Tax=Gymnopus androsaceus JB14 TaxID=1447944 RepID=A0A6A4HIP7_9AGAR|nr:hypothetical protein BT96DRAFT_996250 [Gymnopus androsaceus JB14]